VFCDPLEEIVAQLKRQINFEMEEQELLTLACIEDAMERQLRLLQIEERKYTHIVLELRDKLNDANLAVRG